MLEDQEVLIAGITGVGAGFCTMIGNLAGALMNIYFLALRFPKLAFIGTSAWLFFFINLFKLPFHIWVWKTVTTESLASNLLHIPFLVIGFIMGILLIKRMSNEFFQKNRH